MIREELLHPLFSHFPIAMLILSLFTKVAQLICLKISSEFEKKFSFLTKFLLFGGGALLLPTLFLGDMAFDIIKPTLCNTIDVYKHEELAELSLLLFITCMVIELTSLLKIKYKKYLNILSILTMIIANSYLIRTSHLGAKLVYDHGAGVKKERLKKCTI